jgi:deoxyribodipyrimidine photo-lyase
MAQSGQGLFTVIFCTASRCDQRRLSRTLPVESTSLVNYQTTLCWFRRDLRDYDHAALHHALKHSRNVYCTFVFDTDILDQLGDRRDRRVEFIWHSVQELKNSLRGMGGELIVRYGRAATLIPELAASLGADALFFNHDYEPQAIARDQAVVAALHQNRIAVHSFKDQVVFECDEVLTQGDTPFSVFTPYKKAWLRRLEPYHLQPYPVAPRIGNLAPCHDEQFPSLEEMSFEPTDLPTLPVKTGMTGGQALIKAFVEQRIVDYHGSRDFPAADATSHLSVHLRFGTVSVRELAALAWMNPSKGSETWLSELIWRDFFHMILFHHPSVVEHAFNAEYDCIRWPGSPQHLRAWQEGRTGYPIVDAAMRQLNQTGFMHNRLRMVASSFLVKDLHVDWREGERYFAAKLLDYDLAANNGNWQWAASTGCDAQPWFRIFNPVSQSRKFDPDGAFIRRYVPELANLDSRSIHAPWEASRQQALGFVQDLNYPAPIVDHQSARTTVLELFKSARSGRKSR